MQNGSNRVDGLVGNTNVRKTSFGGADAGGTSTIDRNRPVAKNRSAFSRWKTLSANVDPTLKLIESCARFPASGRMDITPSNPIKITPIEKITSTKETPRKRFSECDALIG
jgi:hypothetical protein